MCVDPQTYTRRDVIVGESVELLCNTTLKANITWTYDDKGHAVHVYTKSHVVDDYKPRLSVKRTERGFHSLIIHEAHKKDSGLYNCYEGEKLRVVGYQLVIAGMWSNNIRCVTKFFTLQLYIKVNLVKLPVRCRIGRA